MGDTVFFAVLVVSDLLEAARVDSDGVEVRMMVERALAVKEKERQE